MIKLYLYPGLFKLTDNNPFGLKVEVFCNINQLDYQVINTVDTTEAPRSQLPYINDEGVIISDSDEIISYLMNQYQLTIDDQLDERQKLIKYLINRMLGDHLYWIIGYSRWLDECYWPAFKRAFQQELPMLDDQKMEQFRQYNANKYNLQGISRYSNEEIYQQGINDLEAIVAILSNKTFLFSNKITSLDCSCYGFLANIYYFDSDTPLKAYISQSRLKDYILRIRRLLKD
ncbi:glutathione S-transferase family protein [Thiotrichales bacterium 19S3-7]|nr:glutathione S-transferase family protein [Thiotrichales bacterium 19S3-7]MCF6802135.1 glutathione S-transferase family protein [Thiotrichales bacterium 19S3-11]